MAKIDFEAKTDRELLVLTAQATNEAKDHLKKLNNSVAKHETRITILETERKIENPANNPSALTKLLNKGKTPGIVIGIAGIAFSSFYALGQVLGWWG